MPNLGRGAAGLQLARLGSFLSPGMRDMASFANLGAADELPPALRRKGDALSHRHRYTYCYHLAFVFF